MQISAVHASGFPGPPCAWRMRSAGMPAAMSELRTASTSSGCVGLSALVGTRPTMSSGLTRERQASRGVAFRVTRVMV